MLLVGIKPSVKNEYIKGAPRGGRRELSKSELSAETKLESAPPHAVHWSPTRTVFFRYRWWLPRYRTEFSRFQSGEPRLSVSCHSRRRRSIRRDDETV